MIFLSVLLNLMLQTLLYKRIKILKSSKNSLNLVNIFTNPFGSLLSITIGRYKQLKFKIKQY